MMLANKTSSAARTGLAPNHLQSRITVQRLAPAMGGIRIPNVLPYIGPGPGGKFFGAWTPKDMPDLSGQYALVTGGNSGIGWEAVKQLVAHNANVIMVSRDMGKGKEAVEAIRKETKQGNIEILECDMQSLQEVLDVVKQVNSKKHPLNLMIADAGVFFPGPYSKTKDGFERTVGINYFAHVLMVMGLLDKIVSSKPARIVLMGSEAETFGRLDWNNLKGDKSDGSGLFEYGNAKLWKLMFGKELQKRLRSSEQGKHVDVFGVHPGIVASPLIGKVDIWDYKTSPLITLYAILFGQRPTTGSHSTLYAATNQELSGRGFAFYGPNAINMWNTSERSPGNPAFHNDPACTRMFEETLSILAEKVGDKELPMPKSISVKAKQSVSVNA